MHGKRWMAVVILGMCGLMAVTGCRKHARRGSGIDDGNIGGIVGEDIDDVSLSGRIVDGMEIPGQFSAVYFAYDSAQVRDSERRTVEEVADYLKNNPNTDLIVEGHCDERGSNEYNLGLGERRAMSIRAYLIGLGLDASRIQTKSYGEESPVAMGHDESSWSQNRRGEFVLVE